jgi:hypothetical protein
VNGAFEPSFPIATTSLLASIGNKPHFGDTRVEKAPSLKMQQIDWALSQANQSVTLSEKNAPSISSRLSSLGVSSSDGNSNQKYSSPTDTSSVREFYGAQMYNWLSCENVSSEGIAITFIPKFRDTVATL